MKNYNFTNPIPLNTVHTQSCQFIALPILSLQNHNDEELKEISFLITIKEKTHTTAFYIREHQRNDEVFVIAARIPNNSIIGEKTYTTYKVMNLYSVAGNCEHTINHRGKIYDLLVVIQAYWDQYKSVMEGFSFENYVSVSDLSIRLSNHIPFRHKMTFFNEECRLYDLHEYNIEFFKDVLRKDKKWLDQNQKEFFKTHKEYSPKEYTNNLKYLFTIYTHTAKNDLFVSTSNGLQALLLFRKGREGSYTCERFYLGVEIDDFNLKLWIDGKSLTFKDIIQCRNRFNEGEQWHYTIKAFLDSRQSDEYLHMQLLINY